MDIVSLIGTSMGSAWLSGLNLYATVAVLGLLGRFGAIQLPGELNVLTNKWVLGVAIGMYVVEFFADKIPYLDSFWDVLHTFIRIPAGAILCVYFIWKLQQRGPGYCAVGRRRDGFYVAQHKGGHSRCDQSEPLSRYRTGLPVFSKTC